MQPGVRTGGGGGATEPEAFVECPLKVLVVVEAAGGGAGRHVVELVDGLAAVGCSVHLIYSDLRADANFRAGLARLRGVRSLRVPMRREPHWSDPLCALRIRRYMHEIGGFDVVHAHSSKAGALARVAALGLGSATVYTPHAMRTMDPTLHPALRYLYRIVEVGLSRFSSDAIIAVSELERSHILLQGVAGCKVCLIPNGVPQAPLNKRTEVRRRLGLGEDIFCVGFVGRLVPQKAPQRFIDALGRLAGRLPNVRGVVVGTGPLAKDLHVLARAVGVFDKIVWITDQPGPAVLPAFDVLLMPSLYEGMPYVLLEALAAGVPIIATDVGGTKEAVDDGITGFVLPQNAADELGARLALLGEDPLLRERMAVASLRKSADLSVENMVAMTLNAYRSAMRAHRFKRSAVAINLDPKQAA